MPIARVTGGTWLEPQLADFFLAIAGLTALAHLYLLVNNWLVVSNIFYFHHIWDNPSH